MLSDLNENFTVYGSFRCQSDKEMLLKKYQYPRNARQFLTYQIKTENTDGEETKLRYVTSTAFLQSEWTHRDNYNNNNNNNNGSTVHITS